MCNGVYHAYPAEFSRRYLPATFLSFLEFETRENNPKGHSIAQKEDINVVKVMNGSFAFGSHLFSEHSKLINQLEIDFFQLRKSPQYGNCCP